MIKIPGYKDGWPLDLFVHNFTSFFTLSWWNRIRGRLIGRLGKYASASELSTVEYWPTDVKTLAFSCCSRNFKTSGKFWHTSMQRARPAGEEKVMTLRSFSFEALLCRCCIAVITSGKGNILVSILLLARMSNIGKRKGGGDA